MRVISEDLGREFDLSRWEVDVDPCLTRGLESTESESVLEREDSCLVLSISERSRWSDITRNGCLRYPGLRICRVDTWESNQDKGQRSGGLS